MHLYIALTTGFNSWQTILKTALDILWKFSKTFYWQEIFSKDFVLNQISLVFLLRVASDPTVLADLQ